MNGLRELVLELTGLCAQHCVHCSSDSGPHRGTHLDRKVALALVEEAAALGVEQVSFGGGEPFASPVVVELIERVLSCGMRAEVFTSGLVPSRRGPASVPLRQVNALSRLRPLKLIFSAHGCEPRVHDGVTQIAGSFDAMMRSLAACMASGIHCEVNFVPLRENTRSFAGLVELAAARGIRRISVLRFVPQGRGLKNRRRLELTRAEEDAFAAQLVALRRRADVEIRTGSPYNGIIPGNAVPCRAGHAKLVVQADGNVLPCEVFKHHRTRDWGLCVYRASLREILGSPQLAALRNLPEGERRQVCPVHQMLRQAQKHGDGHAVQQVSRSSLHV